MSIKFFVFSLVFIAVYLQMAGIGLYNDFCEHFQPNLFIVLVGNSLSTSYYTGLARSPANN